MLSAWSGVQEFKRLVNWTRESTVFYKRKPSMFRVHETRLLLEI